MQIFHLWTVAMTTMFIGITSSASVRHQDNSKFIRRLMATMEERSTPQADLKSAPNLFIPKLMLSLANDFDKILAQNSGKRHSKRGAPYPRNTRRNRNRWNKNVCIKDRSLRCLRVARCGFNAPLDPLSQNKNFGCGQFSMMGEARRW